MDAPPQRRSADERSRKEDVEKPLSPVPSNAHGSTVEYTQQPMSPTEKNLIVIDEAVEAIGFGKFQWQLTLSCGFGFLADQVRAVPTSPYSHASATIPMPLPGGARNIP